MAAAVYRLYDRVLGDEDVSFYFDEVNLPNLRAHMIDFLIAALTGADGGYHGRPLDIAHQGLGITGNAFDRVVEHLAAVLIELGVDGPASDAVVARLAPLRSSIVV